MAYLGPRLRMMRPGNALMAAVAVAVGIVLAADPPDVPAATWIAAPLAAFLVAGFGNVLNDITDRELDRTAHPRRPLPSGQATVRDAIAFAVLLLVFGLYEAWLAGGLPLLAFAAAVALGLGAYERWLKARGLAGNLVVALLVGATFLFGAVAAVRSGAAHAVPRTAWALAAMAALTNLARELVKDAEDAEADRAHRRTFALRHGARAAAGLGIAAVVAAVAVSLWLLPALSWPRGAVAVLLLADVVLLAGAGLAIPRPAQGQRLLKAGMLVALAAFLLGALLPGQWP